MSADTQDLPGRDYDATGLAHFEDLPANDVAADLAALLARTAPKAKPSAGRPVPAPTRRDRADREPGTGQKGSPPREPAPPTRAKSTSARRGKSSTSRARQAAPAARHGRTSGPDGDPGEHVSRILYLPVELVEALRIYRATTLGVSNTQIALGALNAHYLDVDALVAAEEGARVSAGPLFDEVVHERQIPKRQVEITPTRGQLKIIDGLVDGSKAKDRSQLFAVVIRHWLAARS